MNSKATNVNTQVGMVRVKQVAAMLNVSTRTVWRMISDGELTRIRVRGCTGVALAEVQKYVPGVGGANCV